MLPRLVMLYSTGMYQILGELNAELVEHAPAQLGPLDFDDHQSMVYFSRKTPTYLLYREVEEPATLTSGESPCLTESTSVSEVPSPPFPARS